MGTGTGNGDNIPKPTRKGLERILRLARIREARDAQAAAKRHRDAVERARQARVKAQRECKKKGK